MPKRAQVLHRFGAVGSDLEEFRAACAMLPETRMRAKRYQDLIVWQLADQIRVLVFPLTERESFVRDLKLHSQTEDAANSMCRNIAEGFGCKHKEFARFLQISRRSLNELTDSLRAAQLKKYITAHEYEPIWRLAHRLYPAYDRLMYYLRTTPDPEWTNAKPSRAPRTKPAKPHPTDSAKRPSTDPAQRPSTDWDQISAARR